MIYFSLSSFEYVNYSTSQLPLRQYPEYSLLTIPSLGRIYKGPSIAFWLDDVTRTNDCARPQSIFLSSAIQSVTFNERTPRDVKESSLGKESWGEFQEDVWEGQPKLNQILRFKNALFFLRNYF